MKGYTSRRFNGIPIGLFIRGSICHTWTYRVIHGNGFAGSKLGEIIQHRYLYNVSDPHGDHVPLERKTKFATAVSSWQALSDEAKALWELEVKRLRLWMSGFNLFISRTMKDEI